MLYLHMIAPKCFGISGGLSYTQKLLVTVATKASASTLLLPGTLIFLVQSSVTVRFSTVKFAENTRKMSF